MAPMQWLGVVCVTLCCVSGVTGWSSPSHRRHVRETARANSTLVIIEVIRDGTARLVASNATALVRLPAAVDAVRTAVEGSLNDAVGDENGVDPRIVASMSVWLAAYTHLVTTTANNASLTVADRYRAIVDLGEHISTVIGTLGGGAVQSGAAASSLLASLLRCGTALVHLRANSSNDTDSTAISSTIALVSRPGIASGFVQTFDVCDAAVAPVTYPDRTAPSNQDVHFSGVSVNGVAAPQQLRTCTEMAVAMVEFADDSLFPSNSTSHRGNTAARAVRVGSPVLSVSIDVTDYVPVGLQQLCATFDYTVNLPKPSAWTRAWTTGAQRSAHDSATNSSNPRCVWYNHSTAVWSDAGCSTVVTNSTHAECCCSRHASIAMAVLVGDQDADAEKGASVLLSWVGLGMLLFLCLLIVMIIQVCFRYSAIGGRGSHVAPGVSSTRTISGAWSATKEKEAQEPGHLSAVTHDCQAPCTATSITMIVPQAEELPTTNWAPSTAVSRATTQETWGWGSSVQAAPFPTASTDGGIVCINARIDHTSGGSGPIRLSQQQIILAVTERLRQLKPELVRSGALSVDADPTMLGSMFTIMAPSNGCANDIRRAMAAGLTVRIEQRVYTIIAPRVSPSWTDTEGFTFEYHRPSTAAQVAVPLYEDDTEHDTPPVGHAPRPDYQCTTPFSQ